MNEKNTETGMYLDMQELIDPPALHWHGYFWMLNDHLDAEAIDRQLLDMFKRGARSVCPHPMPHEFRPDSMNTMLAPAYLSEGFLEMSRRIADRCRTLGMNCWLYDEGGWPSGSAAGRVYAENPPRYARKTLLRRRVRIDPGESYALADDDLCVRIQDETNNHAFAAGRTVAAQTLSLTLEIVSICRELPDYPSENNPAPYADILNPEVAHVFLSRTHQQYAKYIGEDFGRTIRFTMTDEPAVGNSPQSCLPWTDDLAEVFAARKGFDLLPHLPAMFDPPDQQSIAEISAGIDFFDVWSQLLVERYLLPIREWCRRNGLQSSGHFGGEDEPGGNLHHGFGHILRVLRGLDLPGVDVIWRQLWPEKDNDVFPRYAASAAMQGGNPFVMSESFAVYGSGLTPEQMKWIADYQFVRGVNLLIISNYPYSTREHLMAGCRPHFGPHNPMWKYMDLFHERIARLSYLLSRGRPDAGAALYYDVRGIWAGGGHSKEAVRRHRAAAVALEKAQCEFSFVDDDVLAGREGSIEGGVLKAGRSACNVLIIPRTSWMDKEALKGVREFARQGGTVLAVDGIPQADGGEEGLAECEVVTAEQLAVRLNPMVRLSPPCPELRVCRRYLPGETAIYFVFNEADRPVSTEACFEEAGPVSECELETGRLHGLEPESVGAGLRISLQLPPWGSRVFVFGVGAQAAPRPPEGHSEALRLEGPWTLSPLRAYRVGRYDYEIEDLSGRSPLQASPGDWRSLLGEDFSGDAVYRTEFTLTPGQAEKPAMLDLGDVRYACEVLLNGKSVGRKAWRPYRLDVTGMQAAGKNTLSVTVTNTFANALLDQRVQDEWARREGPGWRGPYHGRTVEFERDSLPGGLFGPVNLLLMNG